MKRIAVLTATRAEYGLLKPIILKLKEIESFDVKILVTGAHLSPEFGMTYREIEDDGMEIDKKIEILLSSDSAASISKSMGLAMIGFAEYFAENALDALLVLGDRYETLAVCAAAMIARIPIFHIHGGETTEGAVDEAIRHSITKMSYLHFTSTEAYRRRVIQLGEDPSRVFTVGSVGVENALKMELLSKQALEESLSFQLNSPYAVMTFHPTTLEGVSELAQIKQVTAALKEYPDIKFIITKANADAGGREINSYLEQFASENENVILVDSLGVKKYLSALKYAAMVIGNSSSGILEAPSFGIPTLNIGNRQKGRIQADSVINCEVSFEEVKNGIAKALTREMQEQARSCINPYEKGDTSKQIVHTIQKFFEEDGIMLMKSFYDISY